MRGNVKYAALFKDYFFRVSGRLTVMLLSVTTEGAGRAAASSGVSTTGFGGGGAGGGCAWGGYLVGEGGAPLLVNVVYGCAEAGF